MTRWRPGDERERLYGRAAVGGPTDCWEWQGFRDPKGYGQIQAFGRKQGAHRAAWVLANGAVPAGLSVLHRCDNPPCVNPAHLFVGTAEVNNADRDAKGRQVTPRGERHGSARLTPDAVREIRRRYAAGETLVSMAREFAVHKGSLSKIVRRVTWSHVL